MYTEWSARAHAPLWSSIHCNSCMHVPWSDAQQVYNDVDTDREVASWSQAAHQRSIRELAIGRLAGARSVVDREQRSATVHDTHSTGN